MRNRYKEVKAKNHPKANNWGFVYEHVIIAEKKLGRFLNDSEVVHHIDKNKHNNSIENLIVFATNADHSRYHKADNPTMIENNGIYFCPKNSSTHECECGSPKSKYSQKCIACENFKRKENRKFEITYAELKKMVWEMPTSKVAKLFNVSSKAIEKRCKSLGIEKPPRGYWTKCKKIS